MPSKAAKAKRKKQRAQQAKAQEEACKDNTPLFVAAFSGDLNEVQKLLSKSQVNMQCQQRRTALHMSAFKNHMEIAALLIKHSADVSIQDEEDFDALMFAAWAGHTEMVQLLLDSKAPIDQTSDEGGTALHLAISVSHTAVAEQLVLAKADLSQKSLGGFTPLHIAAAHGHDQLLFAMIGAGGSLTERTDLDEDVASLVGKKHPYPKDCPQRIAQAVPELWRGRIKAARRRVNANQAKVEWSLPAVDAVATVDQMERYSYTQVLKDEAEGRRFIEHVREPAVIEGMLTDWPLRTEWKKILQDLKGELFEVKCMSTGQMTDIALADFLRYIDDPNDEATNDPLYLFHRTAPVKAITDSYCIPEPFLQNLFAEKWQTDKWLICGCRGSGSKMHIDFYHTSAWNAMIDGHKWWCFFPPSVSADVLKVHDNKDSNESTGVRNLPLNWFSKRLPQLLETGPQPIQLLQRPGETVWVPAGWHHIVLNLDNTVAVTQNFAAPCDASAVWLNLRNKVLFDSDEVAGELMEDLMPRVRKLYPEHVKSLDATIKGQ